MSNYHFSPCPNFGITEEPYVYWENGFTDLEIQQIINTCESRPFKEGEVGVSEDTNDVDKTVRRSKVSWLDFAQDSAWIYDKIAYIVRNLNGQYYKFDIHGFVEDMQYTVYDSKYKGHYNWHRDIGNRNSAPRKLSFVLQLSEEKDYEGGELEIFSSLEPQKIKKQKGFAVLFPSYLLHRVTPVTSGIRKTLVVWVAGPAFR